MYPTVRVRPGNALHHPSDALCVLHTEQVPRILHSIVSAGILGTKSFSRVPKTGRSKLIRSHSAVGPRQVLLIEISSDDLSTDDLHAFGAAILPALAEHEARPVSISMILHGPGYGLESSECFEAILKGLLQGLRVASPTATTLKEIQIIERDSARRRSLEALIPSIWPTSGVTGVPAELVSALQTGSAVAFLGAGICAEAGYPTWIDLVKRLHDWRLTLNDLNPDIVDAMQENLRQGDYNLVADTVTADLPGGNASLVDFLRHSFPPATSIPGNLSLIAELGFGAVLTTNFDSLTETALGAGSSVYTHRDSERLLTAHSRNEFYVLKLCGSLLDPDSVTISPAQYEAAVSTNLSLLTYMQSVFASRTILFLGCSLTGIRDYLRSIKVHAPSGEPRHYAFVEETPGWHSRAEQLRRYYGIQVIPFRPDAEYSQVREFLNQMKAEVDFRAQREVSIAHQGGRVQTPRLATVKLENIGPFDELTLELDDHWTVLLGDNGVGKSTILKAIATGLAGEEATDFAHRIVKRGKTQGVITLETTEGKRYTTQVLVRDISAAISTTPGRMIEGENWLALGFPPHRAITYSATKEPSSELVPRLTAADLAPLLAGESDPRANGLKQWLLNLDYESHRGHSADRSRAIMDRFKKAFVELLPGIGVQLIGIDPKSRRVMVRTPEGELPIEAVSQGTASIVGWVGVVLQRLYAISPQPEHALDRFCVVLIDEIDAHMHPGWQRSLTDCISSALPNAQIIATSHSPLVAGNLEGGQLHRLRREVGGSISHVRFEKSFKGYRVDQILMGAGFDLPATMSREVEQKRSRYVELLGRSPRTTLEEAEYRRLEQELETLIPPSAGSPIEQKIIDDRLLAVDQALAQLDASSLSRLLAASSNAISRNDAGASTHTKGSKRGPS